MLEGRREQLKLEIFFLFFSSFLAQPFSNIGEYPPAPPVRPPSARLPQTSSPIRDHPHRLRIRPADALSPTQSTPRPPGNARAHIGHVLHLFFKMLKKKAKFIIKSGLKVAYTHCLDALCRAP